MKSDAARRISPIRRPFERVLIIKPSSPGDIIHALPVLHGLRRRYPDAHIAWLVAASFADLIAADPALNEVIPFDRRRFGWLGRDMAITVEFASFVQTLRERRFDLVIDLQGLFRSGFIALASGARTRIGFANAREMGRLFYTHHVRILDEDMHAAERNYLVAPLLDFTDEPMDFSVAITPADRQAADQLRKQAGLVARERYAVLVPATRWETKCWAAERFGELARRLSEQCGLRSVLIGGASDEAAGARAAETSGGAAVNLCGRTTLRQLAALIETAGVVVTADSTPMHLAAALGRPLAALFGPTNPARTGPYGRGADVLRLGLECSPCYLKRLKECPYDHACMRDLSVEAVLEAVRQRVESSV
jgi:heptosyltransferase-1